MTLRLLTATCTDVGRVRPGNEDAVVVDDEIRLVAVADGMGGHQAGEVASATAIAALLTGLRDGSSIDDAVSGANDAVLDRAVGDPSLRGMGTTLTAGVLDGDTLLIGHVGDSRAYLLRAGALTQLTTDHSVVAELIAAGELTPAEAEVDPRRAMITRALGIDADVTVDVLRVALAPGDRLLWCSDGLTTMVRDDAVLEILTGEPDRARAAERLVAAANAAGGADNITVAVADVVDDAAADPAALPAAPAPAAPPEPIGPDPTPAPERAGDPPGPSGDPPAGDSPSEDAPAEDPPPPPRRRWWRRAR